MIKQLNILDAIESENLRNAGMQRAEDHANSVSPNWSERSYSILLKFLDEHSGEFMTEQLRAYFALHDYELPPHGRAFGSLVIRAAKAGKIRQTRIDKVSNKRAHRCFASVWVKA